MMGSWLHLTENDILLQIFCDNYFKLTKLEYVLLQPTSEILTLPSRVTTARRVNYRQGLRYLRVGVVEAISP